MPYHSIKDILNICKNDECEFWHVVLTEQAQESLASSKSVFEEMRRMYRIMKTAVNEYDENAVSAGKMAGGGGELLHKYNKNGNKLLGDFLSLVIEYAVKTAESNACMKRIVAAPTAGSCGIIPAVFIAYEQYYKVNEDSIIKALFTASGIGEIVAENASISGAQGGCQAEIGTAAAMAAGGVAYLEGGNGECIANAAALALKNMLGLVCDPVAGLVEVPCIKRNAIGAVNAITAAQMALAGIKSVIPADEVIDAMFQIGCSLPACLRETSQAGLAATPTALKIEKKLRSKGTLR